MRPPQKNRNNRNKNGRNKPVGNVQNRVFESAGPEGKVRGTPQQIIEKYLILARDAQTSGDRVVAENFLQHAEHYIRLLNAAQPQGDDRRPAQIHNGRADFADDEDDAVDVGRPDSDTGSDARDDQSQIEAAGTDRAQASEGDHTARRGRDDRHGEGRRQRREMSETPSTEAASSALETIETGDEAESGLVATPESKAEEEAPKKAEPRRRRRRASTSEAEAVGAAAGSMDATVATTEGQPG
ncbi:MAG: DUF4167 domain-containing protein [Rubrimonas sp.]